MSVENTIKTLRAISQDYENGNDGTSFDVCGECKNAADQLEQLQAENEQLKASQPVTCGECKNFDFGMEYACRCKNGIAQDSYVDKDDYCSYGERRVEE